MSGLKRWLLVLLKAVVSVSIMGYLFSKVDMQEVKDTLGRASLGHLFAAVAVLLLQAVACALRWSMVIKSISSPVRLRVAVQILFIGYFFNQALPSSIGGDAMRVWRIRHHGFPLRKAINSVLVDRVIAMVALALFMLMSYPVIQQFVGNPLLRLAVVFVALALLGGFTMLYYFRKIPNRFFGWRIAEEIRHLSTEAHQVTRTPRRAIEIVMLSIAIHAMTGIAIYEVARGLGLSVGLLECVVLTPPILLVTVLPISIAGWGVREAGMVTALAFAGVAAHDALMVSILFGLLLVLISIPGGVYWLYTSRHPQPHHPN